MHVLGTPPAFVLSQDQTLEFKSSSSVFQRSLISSLLGSKLSLDPSHGSSPCQGSLKLHCVLLLSSALYSFQGALSASHGPFPAPLATACLYYQTTLTMSIPFLKILTKNLLFASLPLSAYNLQRKNTGQLCAFFARQMEVCCYHGKFNRRI